MIYLYTGTPGSGKSYHAAEVIDKALRRGMPVIANFPINYNKKRFKGEFLEIPTLELKPQKLTEYAEQHFTSRKESQGIIIIDEAQLIFNTRTGMDKDRMRWIEFLSNHRKYFYDIILITQIDRMLDRQIRGLIETEYKHRKLQNYGAKGWFMIVLFHKAFVAVQYWYPIQERVGSEFFNCRKRVYSIYDTFKRFDKEKAEAANAHQNDDMKKKIAEFNAKLQKAGDNV